MNQPTGRTGRGIRSESKSSLVSYLRHRRDEWLPSAEIADTFKFSVGYCRVLLGELADEGRVQKRFAEGDRRSLVWTYAEER